MLECAIIFPHYRNDEVTRKHLQILRKLNPYPVIAVCCNEPEHVPEAIDVGKLTQPIVNGDNWNNCDTILYRWFMCRGLNAERYIYLEWDNYATAPVREVYRSVWDADAAATNVFDYHHSKDWFWFNQYWSIPPRLRPFAAGMCPFNGIMLKHKALAALTYGSIPSGLFCELRVATLLKSYGFEAAKIDRKYGGQNVATVGRFGKPGVPRRNTPGIYHPVKA